MEPAGAWRSKTFGCGTPAPFAALDCGFCYFHRVYFAELACDRKPSSARSFWVCPLALWRDTEGGGKFTRDLLQPSDISTERAAAARRPGSCGRPCSLWHLGGGSQISANLWSPLCQVKDSKRRWPLGNLWNVPKGVRGGWQRAERTLIAAYYRVWLQFRTPKCTFYRSITAVGVHAFMLLTIKVLKTRNVLSFLVSCNDFGNLNQKPLL